ncbi:23S rRNA (adenine(2030)-N(6))-methyltransferase RlmJ [Thalassotalea profundi]|uniref:Ribosomal RNA large subunit methyltransferase J n=1 Tax=Thalassotalea profundi TaxID=2036687 RepID=A0ABQ3J4A3_9GAMM|nr:23S rRNA (adenine(2030)-N(6))-methyltransferase RlmJ [Thalassotalea profundi]GHF01969.1 ribosomal RNA large subunit methyltransferase J [Thalassotalea profundi]
MLSYRHAFHAGNFADVLKHSVLTLILEYITRKDKGFTYIDTHSGAGMYQLADEYAQKTGEYKGGIAKLLDNNNTPEALAPYLDIIASINASMPTDENKNKLSLYPGSPGIAREFTRRQDSAHMFELHPTDIQHLTQYCQRWNKSHIKQVDGYQGLLGLLPPPSRRAVVLMDPPYELKEDYSKAVKTLIKAYRKFATGTYILWYPVVKRELVNQMQQAFIESDVKNILQVELCLTPDTDEFGMTGTGLFVINPPWQLHTQLTEIMPFLKSKLGNADSSFNLMQLVDE